MKTMGPEMRDYLAQGSLKGDVNEGSFYREKD